MEVQNIERKVFALMGQALIEREFTSASEVNLVEGMVLGTISASGKLTICKSGATDGSQYPVAIAKYSQNIAAGATENVTAYNAGTFDASGVIFDGSDTFATVVDSKTMLDRLIGDTKGMAFENVQNLTTPYGD